MPPPSLQYLTDIVLSYPPDGKEPDLTDLLPSGDDLDFAAYLELRRRLRARPEQHVSPDPTARGYLARDLVALSRDELRQLLHGEGPGEISQVHVEDPINLPASFIERLADFIWCSSDIDLSVPVDAAKLASKLARVAACPEGYLPGFLRVRRRKPDDPGDDADPRPPRTPDDERVIRMHNSLVQDGAQPCFPIEMIHKTGKDVTPYLASMRPWIDQWKVQFLEMLSSPLGLARFVIHEQLNNWTSFRKWQRYTRGDYAGWKEDADEHTKELYRLFVKEISGGCTSHTEAVAKLLAEYGFARPFTLLRQHTGQDRLTTWIEYLGFVCLRHWEHARVVRHWQPEIDAAWKKLVDGNMTGPLETQEWALRAAGRGAFSIAEDKARQDIREARAFLAPRPREGSSTPQRPRHVRQIQELMAAEGRLRLERAQASLAMAKERHKAFDNFADALLHMRTAWAEVGGPGGSHELVQFEELRVQWVRDQLPLIEAEPDAPRAQPPPPPPPPPPRRRRRRDRTADSARTASSFHTAHSYLPTDSLPADDDALVLTADSTQTTHRARAAARKSPGTPAPRDQPSRASAARTTTRRGRDTTERGTRGRGRRDMMAEAKTAAICEGRLRSRRRQPAHQRTTSLRGL